MTDGASETNLKPREDGPEVVYVLPVLDLSGAERVVAELARGLALGHSCVSVLCLEDERKPLATELTSEGIPVAGLRLSRRRTLACAAALARLLPRTRPLIVHSHLFHANLAARLAYARLDRAARDGVHVVSTIHVAERRFRPWQFWFDRWTAQHARCEVFVSRAAARFHQERARLSDSFIRVIENGIDLARYTPGPTPLEQRPPVVLSVGRLDPQKDFPTLLRAWRRVEAALPGAHLKIAGTGPELDALQRLASSLEIRRVEFLGFVADIPALLRQAALYVQSSAWEGFGLAVVEAMAAGVPVVATAVDSLPEIVTDQKTGWLVPPGDAERLAGRIVEALQNRTLAAQMAAAARAEAVARFSVERMVAEYAELYRSLLKT